MDGSGTGVKFIIRFVPSELRKKPPVPSEFWKPLASIVNEAGSKPGMPPVVMPPEALAMVQL